MIKVGVAPSFKPFSYPSIYRIGTDKLIEAQVGVDIDIAAILAEGLGVDADIVIPESFDRLIPMLQSGEIDVAIAAMSRVFKRAWQVDFSDPYFETGFSILLNVVKGYRLGIGDARSYKEMMESLRIIDREDQLVIAVARGSSAAGIIGDYFPKAKYEPDYRSHHDAAKAVLKAADAPQIMVHDQIFLEEWIRELPRKKRQRVVVFPDPFRSDTYGFAVAKGNLAFIHMLNLFISDKLVAEEHMEKFWQRRHYRFIPGVGIKPILRENNKNGKE